MMVDFIHRSIIPGVAYSIGHNWEFDFVAGAYGWFTIITWISEQNQSLLAVNLEFSSSTNFSPQLTFQKILTKAGAPDEFLVSYNDTERTDIGILWVTLVYDSGLVIAYSTSVNVEGIRYPRQFEYCLDSDISGGYIYLTNTIDPDSLTDLQQALFGTWVAARYRDAESYFGITMTEIETIAAEELHPCLRTP